MSDSDDEVVRICQELIRIDTTNTGDNATCAGERLAAEYVATRLADVGLEPVIRESAPGRTSVVARFPGVAAEAGSPARGALLVHGHLDVVPADPDEWSVPPFSGEVPDGYVWGRGAVDMKDFDAMLLATVCQMRRDRPAPPPALGPPLLASQRGRGAGRGRAPVHGYTDLSAGGPRGVRE